VELYINIAQDIDRQGEERINEEWGCEGVYDRKMHERGVK
jgi:hypothetical protein